MRRVFGIVIALLLAITLLPACGPGEGGEGGAGEGGMPPGGGTPSEYTGFMLPSEGQWVEYVMADEGENFHQKIEHIGQDTVDGKTCIGFEMTMAMPQQGETIVQMWTDAATHRLVKYVMKTGGQVICMDIAQSPYEPPETETPSQYNPSLPDISYGTYTIPGTGGTVTAAIFDVPGGEVWVSSQVPFGTVKVIASGTITMSLYNFGTSGAQRDISKAEMENCMEMPGF